ncbi:MAG: hypothetical protein N3B12_05940, partial [Armatimonadetes bacterium]|nr:hypothetical protein [Armatimonadota bacterium]
MAIRLKGTNIIFAVVVILILVLLFWPTKQTKTPTKTSAPKVVAESKPDCPDFLAKRYKGIADSIRIDRVKAAVSYTHLR